MRYELLDPIERLARERFGLPGLRPMQRIVIDSILQAESAAMDSEAPRHRLAVLPTGAGKSVCFQLPALLLKGPTLVVYPLLSLLADQSRRLEKRGIRHGVLRGGMEGHARETALADAASMDSTIVLATPEMLANDSLARRLKGVGFAHIVIDEAHALVQWGRSFRPAYLAAGEFAARSGIPIISAFTATASAETVEELSALLFDGKPFQRIVGDPDRPNIRYEVRACASRAAETLKILQDRPGPTLVFRSSRAGSEILASELRRRSSASPIHFYHAGLSREEKKAREDEFLASSRGVLVATCAYGMGVDKPDIRTVIHFDPPESIEAYLQESGRAGRDGKEALAVFLKCQETFSRVHARADAPAYQAIRSEERAATLKAYARAGAGCRRAFLLERMGSRLGPSGSGDCGNCDFCDPPALRKASEGEAIFRWVRSNSGRYRRQELSQALSAGGPGWGSMERDDADEALSGFLRAGTLSIRRRGFWKGLVVAEPSVLEGGSVLRVAQHAALARLVLGGGGFLLGLP
jgi:ATP-dependent DNA helicase RecQ